MNLNIVLVLVMLMSGGDFEDTDYPKKMTPEEIIEYYKTFEIPNFYK